ncbi:MAG: hypothetical protein AB9891_06915 [Anaerolineaceae bacterium]
MNLIAIMQEKIDTLDDGEYMPGLQAVLLHIDAAFRHLSRGRKDSDDTAFSDAIYRTNQAFEGSIKEAFRVLAGKEPEKMTPYDIENYLEEEGGFSKRILKQFTNYRTEWRNPSTHDYKLGFDEKEAFLAIVSVTAFACLLVDEIAERVSFIKTKANTEAQQEKHQVPLISSKLDFISSVTQAIQEFGLHYEQPTTEYMRGSEVQIIGALHGFLSSTIPNIMINTEYQLQGGRPFRADLLIEHENEKIIIEVKRRYLRKIQESAIAQVEHYMLIGNIKHAILLFLSENLSPLIYSEHIVKGINGKMIILKPKNEA